MIEFSGADVPLEGGISGSQKASALMPDWNEAQRHLDLLEEGGRFTFQTFPDRKADQLDPKRSAILTRVWHGTLPQHHAAMERYNLNGASVNVTVNETDGKGRTAKNIVRIRAFIADNDAGNKDDFEEVEARVRQLGLSPSFAIDTSVWKRHYYWLTHDCPVDAYYAMQSEIVGKLGTDKNVKDLPRVLRLAGTLHQKEAPVIVRIAR
jgi:hypothetical protein